MTTPAVQEQSTEIQPLKGKYDERGGAREGAGRPKNREKFKSIAITTAYKVLRKLKVEDEWQDLYLRAKAAENYGYCIEILKYLTDRQSGKPFIAANPFEDKGPSTLIQDNRLQVALQMLPDTNTKPKELPQVVDIQG